MKVLVYTIYNSGLNVNPVWFDQDYLLTPTGPISRVKSFFSILGAGLCILCPMYALHPLKYVRQRQQENSTPTAEQSGDLLSIPVVSVHPLLSNHALQLQRCARTCTCSNGKGPPDYQERQNAHGLVRGERVFLGPLLKVFL